MNKGYPFNSKHSYPVSWTGAGDRTAMDYADPWLTPKGVEGVGEPDDSYLFGGIY